MLEFIKEFIERNITSINKSDWEEVMSEWYEEADRNFMYHDDFFNDFVSVMNEAGIPFMEVSLPARKIVIKDYIEGYLSNAVDVIRYYSKNTIKKINVLRDLITTFGFTEEEIFDMMDDVAETKFNLGVDFDEYYII